MANSYFFQPQQAQRLVFSADNSYSLVSCRSTLCQRGLGSIQQFYCLKKGYKPHISPVDVPRVLYGSESLKWFCLLLINTKQYTNSWGLHFYYFLTQGRKMHPNGFETWNINVFYEGETVGKPHFSALPLSHGIVQTEQLFWQFAWVLTLGNESLWLNIKYSAGMEAEKWDNLDLRQHWANQISIGWHSVCHLSRGHADYGCWMFFSSLTSPIKQSCFFF